MYMFTVDWKDRKTMKVQEMNQTGIIYFLKGSGHQHSKRKWTQRDSVRNSGARELRCVQIVGCGHGSRPVLKVLDVYIQNRLLGILI